MKPQQTTPEVAAAKAIATIAHRNQVDKIGVAYIEHPRRIAARLSDPVHVAAAWLHDVVEDCGVSPGDLIAAGISREVVDVVVLLTRTENDDDGYYLKIRKDPVALAVKLADIEDNLDPSRTVRLDAAKRAELGAKYAHARAVLGA